MDAVVTSQLVDRAVALVSGQGDLGLEGPPWIFRLPAIGSPPLGHQYSLTGGPVFGVHYTACHRRQCGPTTPGPWDGLVVGERPRFEVFGDAAASRGRIHRGQA